MSFSELENDTLNQAELNEIKINENNLRAYVKMSEIHNLVACDTKFNNE